MDHSLLILIAGLQAAQLAVISAVTFALCRRKDVPPTETPAPAPVHDYGPMLWEVLKKHDGEWRHHGWVREGKKAFHDAHATPGLALRQRGSEEIHEGVQ